MDSLNSAPISDGDMLTRLNDANDVRLFTVYEALKSGVSEKVIHEITKIDAYFISCLKDAVRLEEELASAPLDEERYIKAKKYGFPDSLIQRITGCEKLPEFNYSYKMVDTCAAEFAAETPYFYSSADKICEA